MHHPPAFRRYLAMLALYLKPQWLRVSLMAVTLLLASGEPLVVPQLIRVFIDTAAHGESLLFLFILALFTIGVALLGQVFVVASTHFGSNVAWTATNEMRRDLLKHCLSLDMSFYKSHSPGEMIARIDGDIAQLANFFSQFLFNLLSQGILLVAALVLLSTIAWFIGGTVTLFVLVAFVFMAVLRRRSVASWEQSRQINAEVSGFLGERLEGIEDIRANGAISYTMLRFLSLLRQRWSVTLRAERISQIQMIGLFSLLGCASLVALAQGAYLWSIHLSTAGTVYLIASYTALLTAPVAELHGQLHDIQQAEACLKRIDQLFTLSSPQQDGLGCTFAPGALSFEFDGVTFGYTPKEPVLHNITFQIQPGKVLGLIGRTGSGKTTIARLLFRLYDPQEGEIRIDGKPLQQARLHDLHQRIGIVTQGVQLFRASVRDNLTFFDRSISDKDIREALKNACLWSWYRRLPDGLDTLLGPEGESLSAGEAQLLAFSRIFLRNPGIVILDEASSRLDPATEALIEQTMEKLLYQRTAIIIAHRLKTVQRADEILLLEDGCIQEFGSRADLAQDPSSRFWHLLQAGLEEDCI